jgi:hypothetical protein
MPCLLSFCPLVESAANQRKHLQEDLHDIILGVLRKRPALRYFQVKHLSFTRILRHEYNNVIGVPRHCDGTIFDPSLETRAPKRREA